MTVSNDHTTGETSVCTKRHRPIEHGLLLKGFRGSLDTPVWRTPDRGHACVRCPSRRQPPARPNRERITDMTALTDFLLARIDEDEQVANMHPRADEPQDGAIYELGGAMTDYGDAHITITTARVLAECEAKRAIVLFIRDPDGRWSDNQAEAADAVDEHALRALAQVYADHPDYDPAWALA